jgi:uncharacterized protein (DUF433 family)
MSTVEYAHVAIGADNVPVVAGTQIKVLEIAQDHLLHGWTAEDIHREFPQLSLGQIHNALGYYYDHQEEIDAEIQRRREVAEQIRSHLGDGPVTNAVQSMRRPS